MQSEYGGASSYVIEGDEGLWDLCVVRGTSTSSTGSTGGTHGLHNTKVEGGLHKVGLRSIVKLDKSNSPSPVVAEDGSSQADVGKKRKHQTGSHENLFKRSLAEVTLPYEGIEERRDEYRLGDLPYKSDGLEPHIDCATVEVHYNGHHTAYTKKMNAALSQWRDDQEISKQEKRLAEESILEILRNIKDVPEKYRKAIQNNGGGFVNHNIYWSVLAPNPTGEERRPRDDLLDDIEDVFGRYEDFVGYFTEKAMTLFGSGYVWLSRQADDSRLVISSTSNQDSVLSDGLNPILVIDLWEHAYYLKHQNRRAQHISDWWRLLDWERVSGLDAWWDDITEATHDEHVHSDF
ncbi:hypothetical protein ScPMuIL_017292 [Solemya velum]